MSKMRRAERLWTPHLLVGKRDPLTRDWREFGPHSRGELSLPFTTALTVVK